MLVEADRSSLLKVLYLTVFLTSTGLGTSSFLLPVYAASLGASYLDLGLLGAVDNVVYTVATFLIGLLLDKFERVSIYITFMVLGIGVVAGFGLIGQIPLLIAWVSLLGLVSAAFWVTASTITANISPSEILSQSMGRFNLSWVLGFIVGPALGGLISEKFGYPALFFTLAGMITTSVVIIMFKIKPEIALRNSEDKKGWSLKPLKSLAYAYITMIPFTLILGIYMAIMPGYLKVMGLAPATVGLLITMTNGVRGIGFFNAQKFVKWGIGRSVPLAALFLSIGMLIFSYASSLLEFAAPLILYGVAAGILTPIMLDYIAKRCDKSTLGAAMGLHEGVYGVGMCVGPLAGGAMAESFGPRLLYQSLSLLALTMIPLSRLLVRRRQND